MTKRKSRKEGGIAAALKRQSMVDGQGIPRVVLLPEGETDARMGIPVSLDLSPLFGHMPADWQREFYKALHARGLVEAKDFLKPTAAELFRSAMLSVIKHDFHNVQSLIKQEQNNA